MVAVSVTGSLIRGEFGVTARVSVVTCWAEQTAARKESKTIMRRPAMVRIRFTAASLLERRSERANRLNRHPIRARVSREVPSGGTRHRPRAAANARGGIDRG